MKYWMSIVCCSILLMACQQENKENEASVLEGKWKIYQVSYSGKDISKSSDPTNENGFWFDGVSQYRRFGNEAHQDTGTYQVKEEWLSFTSQQDSLAVKAAISLKEDTLRMVFPMQTEDTLKMSLYKMAQ